MPERIVTRASLPKILRILDRWQGKLTWPLFCSKVAQSLQVDSVSRHPLLRYDAIQHRFNARQRELREEGTQQAVHITLEEAMRQNKSLKAQVSRLEDTNRLLEEKFRRWQYNAYAHNVPMDRLDEPLPAICVSGHPDR